MLTELKIKIKQRVKDVVQDSQQPCLNAFRQQLACCAACDLASPAPVLQVLLLPYLLEVFLQPCSLEVINVGHILQHHASCSCGQHAHCQACSFPVKVRLL
jgi:hypothetical protein